jgi:hypothetical protein
VSETEQPSQEIERVPKHGLAPSPARRVNRARDDASYSHEYEGPGQGDGPARNEDPEPDWSGLLTAIRGHKVTAACLALILVSLIWKAEFLSHFFYWEDDFQVLDLSLKSHLSWAYLTHVDLGHFFPGVYLIAWLLARVGLYNWLAGSAIVLVMLAAAGLAAWRLLRTLLGNRPAILIPLVIYLFSPLAFPTDAWWITAVEAIPLQIALFMALNSHLHYVRTAKFRYAATSAAWQFFGLFFFEKAAVIPVLLFAVTVGFLTKRRLIAGVRATIVRLWKGWLLYLGLIAAYAAVFLTALSASNNGATTPVAQAVRIYVWREVAKTLVPGLLGGPWHWYHPLNYASALTNPPPYLIWAAIILFLAVIVASVLTRPRAGRAWVILAVWIVLADMLPILLGRLQDPGYAALVGLQTRYVADAPAVVAIVLALAFWPVVGQSRDEDGHASKRRDFFTGRWKAVAIVSVGVFVVGSIVSVQRFQTAATTWTVTSNRVYIANAKAALAQTPAGTVIVSQHVPTTVMAGNFSGDAVTSVVLGPLSHRGSQVSWTSQPTGSIGELKVFGSDGRLWPAAIEGSTTVKTPFLRSCVTTKRPSLVLPFQPVSASYSQVLRIGYVANAAAAGQIVTVTYGSFTGRFTAQSGAMNVYFPVHGSAANVTLQAQTGGGAVCFDSAVSGYVIPFPGSPIPSISG